MLQNKYSKREESYDEKDENRMYDGTKYKRQRSDEIIDPRRNGHCEI